MVLVERSRSLTPLNKFDLQFEYTNYHQHELYVQFWIDSVIADVSELKLHLRYHENHYKWNDDSVDKDGHCMFRFRLLDLARSHVKILKLYFCNLQFPPSTNPVTFASLKSLDIFWLEISDSDLCVLLARCVNLESFKFRFFWGMERMKICSPKLKELNMEAAIDPVWIEICCPSLRKITVSGVDVEEFYSKDIKELEELNLELLNFCNSPDPYTDWKILLGLFSNVSCPNAWYQILPGVQNLLHEPFSCSRYHVKTVRNSYIDFEMTLKVLESTDLPSGCKQFAPNLKQLDLRIDSYNEDDLNGLAALLKLFPRLEILRLNSDRINNAKLGSHFLGIPIVFNMPCLRQVVLKKYHGTKAERYFVELFRKHGVVLEKIKLVHASSPDKNWKTETISQKVIA